jgi:hypothetical protein
VVGGELRKLLQKKAKAKASSTCPSPLLATPQRSTSASSLAASETAPSDDLWGTLLAAEAESATSTTPHSGRRLGRRDTEDAVDRALNLRLVPHYGKALISGAVNEKGERMWDVVAAQVRLNRAENGKLNSKFWSKLIGEFKLEVECVADRLPDPPDDSAAPSDEFMEKLGFVHADNPAARTTEPLERHLDHCGKLTYLELYGLISASMEGTKVLRNASVRLLMKTLEFVARTVFVLRKIYSCCWSM